MKYVIQIISVISLLSFVACQSNFEEQSPQDTAAFTDTLGLPQIAQERSSANAGRKFVRKADLKFRVKDIVRATFSIEQIAHNQQGYIAHSNLTSTVTATDTRAAGPDSVLELSAVNSANTMVIRVPNSNLDSTLNQIAEFVSFLDYRIIQSDDVGLQIMGNAMLKKRSGKSAARLEHLVETRGRKLTESVSADEAIVSRSLQDDQALLANLALEDQVSYCTIQLNMYQRETVQREVLANNMIFSKYTPGFSQELSNAFDAGLSFLQGLIVWIVRLWGIWLFLLAGYMVLKAGKVKSI